MAILSKSEVIQAPPERVFAYVTEPSKIAEWLPSMIEVHNIIGTGAGQQFEWTYRMAGMLLRGQSTVVEYVPNKCAMQQSIGTIGSIWTYVVEPHEEGTMLTIKVEYRVPLPVLGKIAEQIAVSRDARDFALGFDNVRDMLEA